MRGQLSHASAAVVGAVAILLLGMMAASGGQKAAPSVQIRPIEDFLNAQGTGGNGLPAPLNGDLGAFDAKAGRFIQVDYTGLANKWIEEESYKLGTPMSLGTETEGTIIERPLPDGRAEVTVLLHTKNALTWVSVYQPAIEPPLGDLLFGHPAEDVLGGADPALGESFLKWVFINDAPGAKLPDLFVEIVPLPPAPVPHQTIMLLMEASAHGTLREAFGVPEGTPGRAQTTQTGLFQTTGKGATADGYPAEHIKLQVVGR
jgi:hypothetical protein